MFEANLNQFPEVVLRHFKRLELSRVGCGFNGLDSIVIEREWTQAHIVLAVRYPLVLDEVGYLSMEHDYLAFLLQMQLSAMVVRHG